MQVRMKLEVLSPTVQDGKEADFRSEVLGVRRDGFQSLSCGTEENAVDSLLVLESDRSNLFRHGEDDMKVRDLKKFGLAVLKPLGSGKRLTFWAMAIPARNGVRSITCLMESNSLWRVESVKRACCTRRHTPRLSIKTWLSEARVVCR
jgi:hypothetical protein